MEKINEVFFAKEGEKGLTQSSANHLANLATECIESMSSSINNISFIDTELAIIGQSERVLASKGVEKEDIEETYIGIKQIAALTSFVSYIREAIKAKEAELSSAEKYTFQNYCEDNNIILPEEPESPVAPIAAPKATEKDVLSTWDIARRNNYFRLEAIASTYGKFIHKEGAINTARDTMHNKLTNSIVADVRGRDTIIYYYNPSVDSELVDDMYMKLQDEYRSNEKALNGLKFSIKEEIRNINIQREKEYAEQLDEYNMECEEYSKKLNERSSAIASLQSEYRAYRETLINSVSKLKIRIPEALLEEFKYLDSLGKDK